MGLNHLEMYFTDKAAPYIHEAGGKIGGLNFLKTTVPSLRHAILPIQVVKKNDSLTNVTVPAGDDGRYIVRGSDPRDFQGLVDVLKTRVGEKKELAFLVNEVQRHAMLPAVLAYGQYENPGYKGKISVGIQPYLDCQRGGIVEHPNIPDNYIISFVPKDYETGIDDAITCIYNTREDKYEYVSGSVYEIEKGFDGRLKQIVEYYREIDSAGLVKPGNSLQVEFLNSPEEVFIAQVRFFKQKQFATFELDADKRLVFGITPPKGIVLPVYLSPDNFIYGTLPDYKSPWAYLKPCERNFDLRDLFIHKSETKKKADALRFNPKNIAAYLIGQSFGSQVNTSLEHKHFRIAQKANLTIFEGPNFHTTGDFTRLIYGESHDPSPRQTHDNLRDEIISRALLCGASTSDVIDDMFHGRTKYDVRIISNGKTAIVEPVPVKKSY